MPATKIKIPKWAQADVYIPMYHDTNVTKIFYGSRDSAKSDFACMLKVIRCLKLKNFKCLMVRKFKDQVKSSLYDTIESVIRRMKLEKFFEFREHERVIRCVNGNSFMPLGLYESGGKSGNAKSILNPTDAVVDEMDECTEEEWDKLVFSLRGSEDLEIIGIFNTHRVDEEHWIFQKWFPPKETFEEADGSHSYIPAKVKRVTILHTTYKMNPFCTDTKKDLFRQQKETRPDRYDVSGLGLLKAAKQAGAALKNFDRAKVVSEDVKFNPDLRVLEVWDFNRLPHHTAGLWQIDVNHGKRIVYLDLIKEYCIEDESVRAVQRLINKDLLLWKYTPKAIKLIGDYSGTHRSDHDIDSFIGRIIGEIQRSGYRPINNTRPNPSVAASVDFLNDILGGYVTMADTLNSPYVGYVVKIRMHPSCKFHIIDWEKTRVGPGGQLLKVMKTNEIIDEGVKTKQRYQARGHAVDCGRYMVVGALWDEYELFKDNFY